MISCIHPNPWILLCTLTHELLRAEPEAMWVKDGNPSRQGMSVKYRRLAEKREQLMDKFAKNLIDEEFYLQRMGALSLKLARAAHKSTNTANNTSAEKSTSKADTKRKHAKVKLAAQTQVNKNLSICIYVYECVFLGSASKFLKKKKLDR